ncbi:MAG: inositol monophosphatase family protein [Planctomycetota bacterium]
MLKTAIIAARAAGEILRRHFGSSLEVDETTRFDVKLRVDKLCEEAIVSILRQAFPAHAVLAEERGSEGDSSHTWIVDPLDGTVNFFYGIPHFSTSIALSLEGRMEIGVVYDPLRDELFACERGRGATLNGRPLRVSAVREPEDAVVAVGFMKDDRTVSRGLRALSSTIHRVRKVRCMGSAALDLAYVAAGRFTAYYEAGIRTWDIAAGEALLLEAGGRFSSVETGPHTHNVFASNGLVHEALAPGFPLNP